LIVLVSCQRHDSSPSKKIEEVVISVAGQFSRCLAAPNMGAVLPERGEGMGEQHPNCQVVSCGRNTLHPVVKLYTGPQRA